MEFYEIVVAFHVIFSGIWLAGFITDYIFRKKMFYRKDLIPVYLTFSNFTGMVASTGILLTGIYLVSASGNYHFFQMDGNHWLTTKQIIFVVLLVLIFTGIIPAAKKVKNSLDDGSGDVSEKTSLLLKKLLKFTAIMNILVLINFILALIR